MVMQLFKIASISDIWIIFKSIYQEANIRLIAYLLQNRKLKNLHVLTL